jgi:hypothetical protein
VFFLLLATQPFDAEALCVRPDLAGCDDGVVKTAPLLHRIADFAAFLDAQLDEDAVFARCAAPRRPAVRSAQSPGSANSNAGRSAR